ncbi:major facilitator superfamily protein [Actinidia rufa]|uniref:Major facilitator superfamily protein n=1 Tax=Actinidia rufa TaxID=165716 RepID=A0A7J0FY28_9ERIC|nr:major facilitator superfamily protein [Actinidia rufa]
MSGAIIFIQEDLHITEVQEEVLVGILSIISLLGSLAGGKTSDAIGRKWTMAFAAIVFQTGAAIMALAPSFAFAFLMLSRQLAGIGIGLGVMITPVYIGSVWGGSLTSFPGIFINLGIPLGYVSNYAFSSLPVHVNWRVAAGHRNAEKYEEKSVWRELLNPLPEVRRMLITGCGIQCFQQIMGIDATLYYSSTIFREAGIKSNSQLLAATVAVGFTKTIFILVAIFLIDRVWEKAIALCEHNWDDYLFVWSRAYSIPTWERSAGGKIGNFIGMWECCLLLGGTRPGLLGFVVRNLPSPAPSPSLGSGFGRE